MKNTYLRKIFFLKKLVSILGIISLMSLSIYTLYTTTGSPISVAASDTIRWNITLKITDLSGAGTTVIVGEATDASDGQDEYDIAAPPMLPQFPSIVAWFQTPFPQPFNQLIHEYKHYPSTHAFWNLSVVWIPEPGNTSFTTLRIQWDSSQVTKSPYRSFLLVDNTTVLADMLVDNFYLFPTNGTLHRFQIMCQDSILDTTTEQNEIPIFSLVIGAILIITIIIVVSAIFYMRRNK